MTGSLHMFLWLREWENGGVYITVQYCLAYVYYTYIHIFFSLHRDPFIPCVSKELQLMVYSVKQNICTEQISNFQGLNTMFEPPSIF